MLKRLYAREYFEVGTLHVEWAGGGGGGLVKTFSTVSCVFCAHAYALGSPGARHIIRGAPEGRRTGILLYTRAVIPDDH